MNEEQKSELMNNQIERDLMNGILQDKPVSMIGSSDRLQEDKDPKKIEGDVANIHFNIEFIGKDLSPLFDSTLNVFCSG